MTTPGSSSRVWVSWVAVTLGLAVVAVLDLGQASSMAAPVLVAGVTDDGFWGLVGWIVGAAVVGGVVGWGIATAAAPQATTIALVFGIAVGGGLGALVQVFAFGETEPQEPESVTVASASEPETPSPQPADLFDEHPDPVLYFDDTGEGPVVRAVNRAFEETFGVGTDALANAALADASMATDRVDDLVAAASSDDPFDVVVPCETDGEAERFRLRTVTVADDAGTRGYVVYTPADH